MAEDGPFAATIVASAVADVTLVAVFVLVGRETNGGGLLTIAANIAPFIAGLTIGWIGMRAWRAPAQLAPIGLGVYIITVLAGMIIRAIGQEVESGFVLVSAVVLGLFLLGWRAIAWAIRALFAQDPDLPQRR